MLFCVHGFPGLFSDELLSEIMKVHVYALVCPYGSNLITYHQVVNCIDWLQTPTLCLTNQPAKQSLLSDSFTSYSSHYPISYFDLNL